MNLIFLILLAVYLLILSVTLYHLYKYRLPQHPLILAHQPSDKTNLIAFIAVFVSLVLIIILINLIIAIKWPDSLDLVDFFQKIVSSK